MRLRTTQAGWSLPLLLGLALSSCTEAPKPAPPVVATPVHRGPVVRGDPTSLAAPVPDVLSDRRTITAAQQNLHQLGYGSGRTSGFFDEATRKAVVEFQKAFSLAPDGRLTASLAEKLKVLRAELPKAPVPLSVDRQTFVYSDGLVREGPADSLSPAKSLSDDAPTNFLQPPRPGVVGTYHLGRRGKDGAFAATGAVTCHMGPVEQSNVPAGIFDTLAADCGLTGKAPAPANWRWSYSLKLGLVVRQEAESGTGYARDLVAIRPSTAGWPAAARTGLDWALTSTLQAPASAAPVQWSSTGVAPHFEIRAFAALSPGEAGLNGVSDTVCRRFELVRSDGPSRRYPGIACKDAKGGWYLPGGRIPLASPPADLSDHAAPQVADGHAG